MMREWCDMRLLAAGAVDVSHVLERSHPYPPIAWRDCSPSFPYVSDIHYFPSVQKVLADKHVTFREDLRFLPMLDSKNNRVAFFGSHAVTLLTDAKSFAEVCNGRFYKTTFLSERSC